MDNQGTTAMKRRDVPAWVPLLMALMALPCLPAQRTQTQDMCMRMNPSLRSCRLNCPDGFVLRNGCPTCFCKSSLCQGGCPSGYVCEIRQRNDSSGSITEFAACRRDYNQRLYQYRNNVQPTEAPITQKPWSEATAATAAPSAGSVPSLKTLPGSLGSCDFQGRCDATGRCASSDSVCRSDGLCCKKAADSTKTNTADLTPSSKPICLQEPSVGICRVLGVQYVYNVTTGKCQSMSFGGCTSSANSFPTMLKCQATCEYPCQKPRRPGRCRAIIPRYYFNEDTEKCELFDFGGCLGNGNNYMTPWDCETHCKGLRRGRLAENTQDTEDRNIPKRAQTTPGPTTTQTVSVNPEDTKMSHVTRQPSVATEGRDELLKNIADLFATTARVQERGKSRPGQNIGSKLDYRPRKKPQNHGYYMLPNGQMIYNGFRATTLSVEKTSSTASTGNPTGATPTRATSYTGGNAANDRILYLANRYKFNANENKKLGQNKMNFVRRPSSYQSMTSSNRNLARGSSQSAFQKAAEAVQNLLRSRG